MITALDNSLLRALLLISLTLSPVSASAIFSQPAALLNSGPVQVHVDLEISEAAKLLPQVTLRSHIEARLNAAGVQVVGDGEDSQMPSVVTPSERQPAQIWVTIAARRISEPSGYLVLLEVSHLQPILLKRVEAIQVEGLDWHESWALIVRDDADLLSLVNTQLDSLVDDFGRDYQTANIPQR
jgi:hypothetical protein